MSPSRWCNDCSACAVGPCSGSCPVEFYAVLFFVIIVVLAPLALIPIGILIGRVASLCGTPRGPFLTWGRCWILILCCTAGMTQMMAAFFALYAHVDAGSAFQIYAPPTLPPPPTFEGGAVVPNMTANFTLGPTTTALTTTTATPAPTSSFGSVNLSLAEEFGLMAPCDARWHGVGMFTSGHEGVSTSEYFARECAGASSGHAERADVANAFDVMRGLQIAAACCTYLGFIALNALANAAGGGVFLVAAALLQMLIYGLAAGQFYHDNFCGSGHSLFQLGFRGYLGYDVMPYTMMLLVSALALVFAKIVERTADPNAPDFDAEQASDVDGTEDPREGAGGFDEEDPEVAAIRRRHEAHQRQRNRRRRGETIRPRQARGTGPADDHALETA